jgi:hypothetical protein
MSNFLNFAVLSYFCCQSHSRTLRPPTNLFKCDVLISYSSFGKSKEMGEWRASNRNWEQIYRALACFPWLKNISIGHLSIWTGWMPLSEYWTPPEWYWVNVNALEWVLKSRWTSLSVHECIWVSANNLWASLSAREHHGVSANSPECNWVHMNAIKWSSNATHQGVTMRKNTVEWVWTPLNSSRMWLSAHECIWVSVNTPWMPLSVHKCLLVSIEQHDSVECTWMPLSENWTPYEDYWMHLNVFE